MDDFLVIFLSSLTSVSTLLLISLGLAVIFGLMRIVNMAHGEFLMIGAFTVTSLVRELDLSVWLAIAVAPFITAAVGVVIELTLIRPLYKRRLVDTLLVTFGLSLVLFQLAVNVFGTTSPGVATPFGSITIGAYSISGYSLFLPVATAAIIGGLFLLFKKTRYGLLARATAQNAPMSSSLGVASGRINLITFALGCGLAGLGGALIAPTVAVSPGMGQSYVAQAFMTVVTGGPAFLLGTATASTLLGGLSNLVSQVSTTLWGVACLMLVAMVVIRFLPDGLSGHWRRQL